MRQRKTEQENTVGK